MRPHPSSLSHVARAVIVTASVAGFIGGCDRDPEPAPASAEPAGSLELLTDPFLQQPADGAIEVAWFTEYAGDSHHVLVGGPVGTMSEAELREAIARGDGPGIMVFAAESVQLSRVAEDGDSELPADRKPATGIVARDVFRHHANVTVPGTDRQPYRVVSTRGDGLAGSGTFSLRGPLGSGERAVIMLTSDHQGKVNTPANLELAARTIIAELGQIDAVFAPGDLVNTPDRASEWFDDQRGSAFFPGLQGNGGREATDGKIYRGGEVIQHAPFYPAIGNHEVQGRRAGHNSLDDSFNNAVPRAVAEAEYEKVSDVVNPNGDSAVKAQWIEDNSFSTTTYEEIFSLPTSGPGGPRYYATTVGDVRLVSLFATRIWRPTTADRDPVSRADTSRYQEAPADLADPLAQGYGEFIFEDLAVGSRQHEWLVEELNSAAFNDAKYTVVMMHEGPHGLGDNAMPPFAHPQRIEEPADGAALGGVRYEYPAAENVMVRDLEPVFEQAGVDLVFNGHSHLWNRFVSPDGVNYLEASNTGNSYGAFHPLSGESRPVPPAPWDPENYLAQGSPGGLDPVVPTISPLRDADGRPLPYIADNDVVVFQAFDTGTGIVTSWYVDMRDPQATAVKFDEFSLL
ncbi:metallophosphoesterase family protein [Mycolicibacterium vanbaalenii]|uniref:metallophosphoesterase family protein n=1 Tax=Mycolicibacterium vanbaalenii TaxID=110539 RepID=UPI00190F1C16|nr:metallophosphoesterase [Mycolicibacterium vanbaalenii]